MTTQRRPQILATTVKRQLDTNDRMLRHCRLTRFSSHSRWRLMRSNSRRDDTDKYRSLNGLFCLFYASAARVSSRTSCILGGASALNNSLDTHPTQKSKEGKAYRNRIGTALRIFEERKPVGRQSQALHWDPLGQCAKRSSCTRCIALWDYCMNRCAAVSNVTARYNLISSPVARHPCENVQHDAGYL